MEFSPLRKAAIRLACAHTQDREWILAQLEPAERRQINELLEEISLLGITSDRHIVATVMSEMTSSPSQGDANADRLRLLANSMHPFWASLVLQLETPALRNETLNSLVNSSDIRHWDTALSHQTLPTTLVANLSAYLAQQEASNERS